MTEKNIPIEHELIRDGLLFEDIEILETKITPTVGDEDLRVEIVLQADKDLLRSTAFALIYVLALQSFADARPRGASGQWYEDGDQFTSADLLRHLTFERRTLRLDVDYLRGRCVKTTVEVSPDGRVRLDTVNRGRAATRWVDRIKGKSFLSAVDGEGS
jgi:hypothetical protein